eukprot:1161664-Pelagomonas_calceolata.AAC.23
MHPGERPATDQNRGTERGPATDQNRGSKCKEPAQPRKRDKHAARGAASTAIQLSHLPPCSPAGFPAAHAPADHASAQPKLAWPCSHPTCHPTTLPSCMLPCSHRTCGSCRPPATADPPLLLVLLLPRVRSWADRGGRLHWGCIPMQAHEPPGGRKMQASTRHSAKLACLIVLAT